MGEIIVQKMVVEGHTAFCVVVVLRALDWLELPGRERVVVVVHRGHHRGRNLQSHLGAVTAWYLEVGMPADRHRLQLLAYVLGRDRSVDGVSGKRNGQVQVGVRKPVAAKISRVDDAGDRLPVRSGLRLKIFHLSLRNQAVDCNCSSAGLLAGKVRRQRECVAAPLRDHRFAIGGRFAQDAVGIGNQEGSSKTEGQVAQLIFAGAVELVRRFL